jgi:uncharacterized protein YecE (DUF72 family)
MSRISIKVVASTTATLPVTFTITDEDLSHYASESEVARGKIISANTDDDYRSILMEIAGWMMHADRAKDKKFNRFDAQIAVDSEQMAKFKRMLQETQSSYRAPTSAWIDPAEASSKILIGTSGFKYKHWAGAFYPQSLPGREWLKYYAQKFPTVEISSTFHHLPEPRVINTWRSSTPDGFIFAVRAPAAVTHEMSLRGCGPLMASFMRRMELLGDKLGPVTFQLKASEPPNPAALEAFAKALPSGFRYSIEFRSEPWHSDAVADILSKYNIATVIVGHSYMGIHTRATADWSHIRMSGHDPDYKKNKYNDIQLKNWRGIIADARKPAYVYFNNEFKAFAAENAARLMEILSIKSGIGTEKTVSPQSISPELYGTPVDDRATDDLYVADGPKVLKKHPDERPKPDEIKDLYPKQDW